MTGTQSVPQVPLPPSNNSVAPESVWRLIVFAVGWILFAFIVASFAESAVSSALDGDPRAHSTASETMSSIVYYSVLLCASFVRGHLVGNGDLRAGLGNGSIKNNRFFWALTILTALMAALEYAALYYGYINVESSSPRTPSMEPYAWRFFRATFFAPLTEELIFRGWLWNGLRKHLGWRTTALTTSVLFAIVHGPTSFLSFARTAASGMLFSFGRHFGGSVRAAIALHAIWNLTVWLAAAGLSFLIANEWLPGPN